MCLVPQNLPLVINFVGTLYKFVSVLKITNHIAKPLYLCGFWHK